MTITFDPSYPETTFFKMARNQLIGSLILAIFISVIGLVIFRQAHLSLLAPVVCPPGAQATTQERMDEEGSTVLNIYCQVTGEKRQDKTPLFLLANYGAYAAVIFGLQFGAGTIIRVIRKLQKEGK